MIYYLIYGINNLFITNVLTTSNTKNYLYNANVLFIDLFRR